MAKTVKEMVKKVANDIIEFNDAKKQDEAIIEVLQEDIKEINDKIKEDIFAGFIATDSPFLSALKDPYFKVKKLSIKKDDKGVITLKLDESEALINLIELEDYYIDLPNSKGMLSVDGQWRYSIEAVARVFAQRLAKSIEAKNEKTYFADKKNALSDNANGIKLPDATSNNQTEKLLQFIVDGIVFEGKCKEKKTNKYKVIAKDIAYVESLLASEGKTGAVKVCGASKMLRLITKMAHRIVTKGDYSIQ